MHIIFLIPHKINSYQVKVCWVGLYLLPFVCCSIRRLCCWIYVAVCLFYVRLLLQVCCRMLLYCITTVHLLSFVCCCAAVAAGMLPFLLIFLVRLLSFVCCCAAVAASMLPLLLYCCCSSVAVCMLLYSYVFFIRFIALCLVLNVCISMAVTIICLPSSYTMSEFSAIHWQFVFLGVPPPTRRRKCVQNRISFLLGEL